MEFLAILVIGAIVFFVFIAPKFGNIEFWKIASKYPEESWAFFNNHPDWFIESTPPFDGYCGPYKALNPRSQTYVNVYCRNLAIAEQSQKEFMIKFR